MNENDIGTIIVDCAVKIHRVLGPGLMESVYEAVLEKELERQGLAVQRQVPITI
ncbi:MAG: GxxExxY protein, partial [Planctomycetota bacterium]